MTLGLQAWFIISFIDKVELELYHWSLYKTMLIWNANHTFQGISSMFCVPLTSDLITIIFYTYQLY